MVALQEDLLLEMGPEARDASGNLVHAFAQPGHQGGFQKVLDDDKAIVLEGPSPCFRCVLHRPPPVRRLNKDWLDLCIRRGSRIGVSSYSRVLPPAYHSFY